MSKNMKLNQEDILKQIDIVEQKVKKYKKLIKKKNILELECPYKEAEQVYLKMAKEFEKLGDKNQAEILFNGAKQYQEKNQKDHLLRNIEKRKKNERKKIKNIALVDDKDKNFNYSDKKKNYSNQKSILQQNKKDAAKNKQKIDKIFNEIEEITKKIKDYESNTKKFQKKSPYEIAIRVYMHSVEKLKNLGWNEESQRIFESIQTLQEKLKRDIITRRKLKLKQEHMIEEKEEIEQKAKLTHEMQKKHLEEIQKAKKKKEEEKLSAKAQAEQIFNNIEKITQKIKEYESTANRFQMQCPYEEAIQVYKDSVKKLKILGWNEESQRIFESIQTLQEKLKRDIITRRKLKLKQEHMIEEKEEIEQKAKLTHEMQKKHLEEIQRAKKKKEEEKLSAKAQAEQIFNNIEKISQKIKEYESIANRFQMQSPYEEAIQVYKDSVKKLKILGWNEESQRIFESIQTLQEKLKRDIITRRKLKLKQEHMIEEKEEIEQKAKLTHEMQKKHLEEIQRAKKKKEEEKLSAKAQAEQIFNNIEKISQKIKEYESIANRFQMQSPYEEAIQVYKDSVKKLKNLGWNEESQRIFESIQTLQEKLKKDSITREKIKQKEEQIKKEQEKLEKKAKLSQIMQKRQLEEIEKAKKEQNKQRLSNKVQAENILAEIEKISQKIKEYESTANRFQIECPYEEAIEIFTESAKNLNNLGWNEESQRIFESIQTLQEKLKKDSITREKIKQKEEQIKKEQEKLEKKAKLSQIMQKRQLEEIEKAKKEQNKQRLSNKVQAENILAEIEKISQKIKEYESTANRFQIECPYKEAIQVYTDSAKHLKNIGWNEESQRIFESIQTLQKKLKEDEIYRRNKEIEKIKLKEEQEELEKKAKLSQKILMERQKEQEEQKKRELQEQLHKRKIAEEIFKKIDVIENKIKDYENKPDKIPYFCPYKDAIKIYEQASDELKSIGWTEQGNRIIEAIQRYKEKLEEDQKYRENEKERIAKSKEEEEMLKRRIRLTRKLQEQRQKEQEEIKLREAQDQAYKQAIANQIFAQIEKIESDVKEYENKPDKIPFTPPYKEAIQIYDQAAKNLAKIGWHKESLRVFSSVKLYKDKLRKDQEYREQEKQRIEKTLKEKSKLEQRAKKSRENLAKKEMQRLKRKQRIREENAYKQAIANQVFNEIDQIERKIKEYENLPDKIPYNCPYENAIEVYQKSANRLREIGRTYESIKLFEGMQLYQEKLRKDHIYREEEKLRVAKNKEEEELLEKRAQKVKEIALKQKREQEEKRLKEQQEMKYKQAIADQIFAQIEKIEEEIKEYESLIDKIPYECPYKKAINIYLKGVETLKEIGWTEESIRLFEGLKLYRDKLEKDKKYREEEKLRIAKSKEEQELLERRAKLAEKLQKQREQELQRIKRQELQEKNYKMAIADQIFTKIDAVEKEVEEYESQIDKIPFEPPYEKCIQVYKECAQQLIDIGWNKESLRLLEGVRVYQEKLRKDQMFREKEKLRVAKTKEEQEMLEKRAKLAAQILKEKQRLNQERLQKEKEENTYKESVANNIFADIEKIEHEVKEYESLPDKIPYICPYEKAIEVYQKSANRLREIGKTNESIKIFEGMQLYQEKLRKDQIYREEEKLRVAKTKEEQKMLEERAKLAKQIQIKHQQMLQEQLKKKEEEEKEKSKIAEKVFASIDKIENKVREYESHSNRYPLTPPYEEAIQVYLESAKTLEQIGWKEESSKLYEGLKSYKERVENDKKYRTHIKKQQEIQKLNELALKQQIEQSQEILKEKLKKEEREKALEFQEMQKQKEISEKALNIISGGNKFAQQHKYKEAIIKYLEASKLFQEIGWKLEADKIAKQIDFFKQEEINYLKELQRQEEERLKSIKEYEDLERKARISWKIKQREKLEQEKIRKKREEEKRKKDLEEIQRLIAESQKYKEDKEQKLKILQKEEQQKAKQIEEIHNQCLILLDNARNSVENKNYEDALKIYEQVLNLYEKINYKIGIRITKETIEKTKQDLHAYQEQIILKEQAEQDRKKEIQKIQELIKRSKEESERILLEEQKRKLEENEIKSKQDQIQNQIFDLLEMGSNYSLQHQYDAAISKYKEALVLFDEINWPLKKKQIIQLINETETKKETYLLKLAEIQKRKEEELLQRKNFEKQMASQEMKRRESLQNLEEISMEERRLARIERERGDLAYKYLDLAEKSYEEHHPYLSLYYLHNAMYNFTINKWTLEANTTKKRLYQIFEGISNCLIKIKELLQNTNFELEKEAMEEITQCYLFLEKEEIKHSLSSFERIRETFNKLNWTNSLEKLSTLYIEIYALKAKIDHRNQLPTKEDGFELLNSAYAQLKEKNFDDAILSAEKAAEIFEEISMPSLKRLCDQTKLRIKLSKRKYENEKTALERISLISSPELRREARIELRKKIRRALRHS
ncbi:MAG: hypothetical protein K9W44_16785 [Candidatus Lokiarchaeota archaeon]|nr:hypothetical protein [Candidatus Harpocratesius repetitus]